MQWKVDDTTQETLDTYGLWAPYAPRKCDSNCCCLNPQFCLSTNFLLFTRNTYKRYLPTFTFFILKLLSLSLSLFLLLYLKSKPTWSFGKLPLPHQNTLTYYFL